MTAPNIAANTAIYGRSAGTKLTTTSITTCLQNSASSGTVLKVNSILAANINGVVAADISISVYNGTTDWYIVKTLSVPPDATQIVLTKENYIYIEEGVSIRAQAGTANAVDILISYEEIA
jgi:hypothetical protein